jgi:hypothetical protein
MAVPTAETVASGHPGSSCDLAVEAGRESGKRLLVNGAAEGEPLETGGVLVWAPLKATATALALPVSPGAEPGLMSGYLAGTLEFLDQARSSLRTLRVLEAGASAQCCGSRVLVELATEELELRAVLHQTASRADEEVGRLRAAYAPREAGDWAVCEWNSRSLDPLEAAGILLVDAGLAGGGSPLAYVLWQDVDQMPRAWEAFADLPDPRLLQAALTDHFRYVARDEELLVIDDSPIVPLGRRGPLAEELVHTAPFARPPLPETLG